MDVKGFLGGRFLTHLDLPSDVQVWNVANVQAEVLDGENRICVLFKESPKPMALNKTNLRMICEAYGTETNQWIGKPLEVYRDTTQFQGRPVQCIRVRSATNTNGFQPQQHPAVLSQDETSGDNIPF